MRNQKSHGTGIGASNVIPEKHILGGFTYDKIYEHPGHLPQGYDVWRVMWKPNGLCGCGAKSAPLVPGAYCRRCHKPTVPTDMYPICIATCVGPNGEKMASDLAVKMNEFLHAR